MVVCGQCGTLISAWKQRAVQVEGMDRYDFALPGRIEFCDVICAAKYLRFYAGDETPQQDSLW